MGTPRRLLVLLIAAVGWAGPAAAQDDGPIGGHSEAEWRAEAQRLEREVERAAASRSACEEHEAPAELQGVPISAGTDHFGHPVWAEAKSCDDARADEESARRAHADFEDLARRAGVPPGWLR